MILDFKEKINDKDLKRCAESIKNGNLVIFPTETIYGIGADGLNETAVKKIYEAKGRKSDNPLILHISNKNMINDIAKNIGDIELKLIDAFFPGPLTIIFEKKDCVPSIVTGGLNTVAVRMPSNEIANKLKDLYKNDKDELKKYTQILYAQARLIEGLNIENPTELSNLICEVMSK